MFKKFTIIELLLVISVISILAAIIIPNTKDVRRQAFVSKVNGNIRNIQTAVDLYSYENGGKYPSNAQPTMECPELINFDMLYPKYLKSLPEIEQNEYYWIDFMGKAWGSTIDAPTDIFETSGVTEWNTSHEVDSYNIYTVSKLDTLGSANNRKIKMKQSVVNYKDIDRFVSKTDEKLLISAVDSNGLETAPVGMNYRGVPEDWFSPIIKREGTFSFEITANELMYWDGFYAREDKPEGTDISYGFSVQNEQGVYGDYIEDFDLLEPSKAIRIKVTMVGHNGKLPSLLDFRLYYHYSYENKNYIKPERVIEEGKVIDRIKLKQEQSTIESITFPDVLEEEINKGIQYEYSSDGITYKPINSIHEIPKGNGYLNIIRNEDGRRPLKAPIVKVTGDNVSIQDVGQAYNPSKPDEKEDPDPQLKEKGWENIQEIVFVGSSGDGQIAHWISVDIEDVQPENTRILYRYSTGNGMSWSNYVDNFSSLPDSKMIKVRAVLQVKEDFLNKTDMPEVVSIKINSSKGVLDLDTVKPTVSIGFEKDNNKNSEIISNTSNLTWNYETYDPNGNEIIDVVWGGDKRDNYETPGEYVVTLKVRNSLNYWSNETKFKFEVKEEKPTAVIGPVNQTNFSVKHPVELDFQKSIDPDGDTIVSAEWGGDYKKDGMYSVGEHTITLRVQDSEGNWSDWTEKKIIVGNSLFYGFDANNRPTDFKAFDDDPNTSGVAQTIYWVGDLSGRIIAFDYATGWNDLYMRIYNNKDEIIAFEDTEGNVMNARKTNNNRIKDFKFFMPENASYIKFSGSVTEYVTVFGIYESDDTTPASPVTNITSTSDKTTLTLNWTNPTEDDFASTWIYKDNKILAKVNKEQSSTFTEKSLFSDTEYTYQLYSVDTTGNRSQPITVKVKTQTRRINWSGPSAGIFDSDLSTFIKTTVDEKITWTGDLANKTITMDFGANIQQTYMGVYDENGNLIPFQDTNGVTYEKVSGFGLIKRNFRIVVPENAAYILFKKDTHVYNIYESDDYTPTSPVTNVLATSDKTTVTLNWTNPTEDDYASTWIYRNGMLVGNIYKDKASTFTEKALIHNMEYTYSLYSVDTTGNKSEPVSITIKTKNRDIDWQGPSGAIFDSDLSTFIRPTVDTRITWNGNLDNKMITIDFGGDANTCEMAIYDENNNLLSYQGIDGTNYTMLSGYKLSKRNFKIIVPENAAYILFKAGTTIYNIYENEFVTEEVNTIKNLVSNPKNLGTELSWAVTDTNYKEFWIYRDGIYVGKSTSLSYFDTPLLSDMEYTHSVRVLSKNENLSDAVSITSKTLEREVNWRGVDPQVFDGNKNVYVRVDLATLTWDKNIENKIITITTARFTSSQDSLIYFRGENGTNLEFTDTSGKVYQRISSGNKADYNIIVPIGTKSIHFVGATCLYEISLRDQ